MKKVKGNIVDVLNRRIQKGIVWVDGDFIAKIEYCEVESDNYIVSGLIDSHVHVESSMLVPSRFAELVVRKGTVATVSDPHEIANVIGLDGVRYMIEDAARVPLKVFFGAPSCVPATSFEASGAHLSASDLRPLFEQDGLKYLSEMMNFPGVIYDDPSVKAKLDLAKEFGVPVDGHAPGLVGDDLSKYVGAGVSTDHECFTVEEATAKIDLGMKVQIREGSAAKNFEALWSLIDVYPDKIMLCTDDAHPDHLIKYHLDDLLRRAVVKGVDIFNLLQAVTVNPVKHYDLEVGLLREGDSADIVVFDNLKDFNVLETYVDGEKVFDGENVLFQTENAEIINKFERNPISIDEIQVEDKECDVKIIKAIDGELITEQLVDRLPSDQGMLKTDLDKDYLKIVVLNRYENTVPIVGFIHGFELKRGALASSVAHDSHNIVAVGVSDEDIVRAVNEVVKNKGGIVAIEGSTFEVLPLPVAGLMSNLPGIQVAERYESMNNTAKKMGTNLKAPFMTMAFMPLLVIPTLKIGDKGLFDVTKFELTSLYVE